MINELNEVYYLANYLTLYSVQLTWLDSDRTCRVREKQEEGECAKTTEK